MRIIVTGVKGMLGRRVAEVARERGHDVYGTSLPALDVTDAQAVFDFVGRVNPDATIHCAAYTDVDGAEANEDLALEVNAHASAHVAAASGLDGAFVVAVSTDYVFGGDADRPYVESDKPSPRSAYGRTKLLGERAIAGTGVTYAIARTAWLYGAGGKNFVDTMLELGATRDEVSVVTDEIGCPTWTGHLAPALLDVAERGLGGIHHLAGGGHCSRAELAEAIFARAGLDCRVVPVTQAEYGRPAPRPAWSVLASEREDAVRLPSWQDGLDAYLKERS
jgi:dTDP-4-dehydrorhamnose reductase